MKKKLIYLGAFLFFIICFAWISISYLKSKYGLTFSDQSEEKALIISSMEDEIAPTLKQIDQIQPTAYLIYIASLKNVTWTIFGVDDLDSFQAKRIQVESVLNRNGWIFDEEFQNLPGISVKENEEHVFYQKGSYSCLLLLSNDPKEPYLGVNIYPKLTN